jgi:SAM-dependent methyltransferase
LSKDSWLDWYEDRQVEENVAKLARTLKQEGISRVLDFGCGTGRHAVFLAREGFETYGFDWSEAAINRARRELAKEGLRASLQIWDMVKIPLPYENSFFGAVFAVRVFHHTYVENIRRIASEMERITRAKGYLYAEVPTYDKGDRMKTEWSDSEEPEPGTFVPQHGDERGIPHHHFDRQELLELFPGFRELQLEERHEHFCLTVIRT